MIVYEFNCRCCRVERTPIGRGRRRATYWLNGEQIDGIEEFAEVLGLHKNTLTWRLKKGLCLQQGLRVSREELVANRRRHAEPAPSEAVLAAAFCRLPRPAV